jgi:DNA-binding transcriptional LysR family regulator
MNLTHLDHFLVLAEYRHFGRAAERLGLGQPALSKSLQRLESEVGGRLFERGHSTVRLTRLGDIFRPHAEQMLAQARQARRAVLAEREGESNPLVVGATPVAMELIVMPAVGRLLRRPGPPLKIRVDMSDRLLDGLQRGTLDIVVGPLPPALPAGLQSEPLRTDAIAIAAREGHPLADRTIAPEELADAIWALPAPGVWLREQLSNFLVGHGLAPPRVQVEIDQVGTHIHRLLAQSDLLGPYAGRIPAGSGTVPLRVRGFALSRTQQLVWRTAWATTRPANNLLAALRATVGRRAPG